MDEIHEQFPWISYSDLWTLGGIVAVQGDYTLHASISVG